jgi:LacI family transcriptional regulator
MTTIREIARRAGVSIGTVDRVLHDRGRVSRATLERIRQIIAECNYKPNVFASHLSLSKRYAFGVLAPDPEQDGRYWELPVQGIEKAAAELRAYQVRIRYFHYDKYSEASFERAADRVLRARRGLDGLVVAPVLSGPSEAFVGRIPDGLPYVFIDSYVPETACLSSIGQNPYRSGGLAGRLMALVAGGRGRVAVCRHTPQDYHIDDRVNGFLDHWRSAGFEAPAIYEADRRGDGAVYLRLMPRIRSEHPDLSGVFVPSSLVHQAAQALKEDPPARKIHVIGYDLVGENLPLLREGWIDFVISQRPEVQGYQAVQFLHQHLLLKNPVPRVLALPLDIVTRENLESFIESAEPARRDAEGPRKRPRAPSRRGSRAA